jgi:hypothetical protein
LEQLPQFSNSDKKRRKQAPTFVGLNAEITSLTAVVLGTLLAPSVRVILSDGAAAVDESSISIGVEAILTNWHTVARLTKGA